jgi:hypothetical protein
MSTVVLLRNRGHFTTYDRTGNPMKIFATFLFLLLAFSGASLPAQSTTGMVQDTAVTSCRADANGSYVSSLSCSLGAVPAADTIICSAEAGDSGPAIQVTDNINGAYDIDTYGVNNAGYHEYLMVWSFANTAPGSTTVTMKFSIAINATGFSCAAFKRGRATNILDPTFFGWNDGMLGSTTSSSLTTSTAPAHNGELVYCAMSTSNPTDGVRAAGSAYTTVNPSSINSIFPMVSSQATSTGANCPYSVAPEDYSTNTGLAFLSSASPAGIRPYQGMILTFAGLTNGSVPTYTQLSQSVSGGVPGWFGPELDWYYNPFWAVANTHSDVFGSTTGPTAGLSSTLYLPAQKFETANSASYTSYRTYNGNSPLNLEMITGHYGDGIAWNVLPAAKSLSFGYYLQWDIPNTDSSSHSYGLGGAGTGHASTLALRLAPTGSRMELEMVGGANGTTIPMGTGNPSTTYWVTGNWTTGGTLSMSYYSGCPGACSLVGSSSVSDASNVYPAAFFALGLISGTQAAGDHIWWRNFKMCPAATYPCLP